jgi:hypothetical protein
MKFSIARSLRGPQTCHETDARSIDCGSGAVASLRSREQGGIGIVNKLGPRRIAVHLHQAL